MFICDKCKQQQPAKTRPQKVVTKKRPVTYLNGGYGTEIVREVNFCPACVEAYQQVFTIT